VRKLHGVTVVDEPAVCSVWYVCGLEAPREEELPTVDEEISLPVLVDEKDEKFFDPQLVFEGKWREVETLEEYDSFEVVTQEESKRLVRDEGGKEISTRWVITRADGLIKCRYCAREFATYSSFTFFAPTSSPGTARTLDAVGETCNLLAVHL